MDGLDYSSIKKRHSFEKKINNAFITKDKVNSLAKGPEAQRFLKEVTPSLKDLITSYVNINNELISSLEKSLKETGLDEANKWNDYEYNMFAEKLFAPYKKSPVDGGATLKLPASYSAELQSSFDSYAKDKSNFKCGTECRKGVLNYLKQIDFESELKAFSNKNNIESLVAERSSAVLAHYSFAFLKTDTTNLKTLTTKAEKKMLSFIESTFSDNSSLKFKGFIKDIYVSSPAIANSKFEELKAKYIRNIADKKASVSRTNMKNRTKPELIRMYLELRNGAPDDIDPLDGFNYWAEAPLYANDHFAPAGVSSPGGPVFKKDTLNVSPFVCTNHRPGEGIVLHELGHALNHAFKNNKLNAKDLEKYKKMRKCVQNSYNFAQSDFQYNEGSVQEGDFQNTEEDMADLISFTIRKNDPYISSCSLMKTTFDKKRYIDISLLTDKYDPHSTPFLRVLKEAISKQNFTMPNECKTVIESNKEDYNFEPCM